jgi:hypothetical protein
MAQKPLPPDRRGIYNVEYFSGAQASLYIGDVWVDECTGITYQVSQNRTPLYGYADTYWRDVSEGQVIVQGQFSINFKEAGYLWLVLDRYRTHVKGRKSFLRRSPFLASDTVTQQNIERVFNGETTRAEKYQMYRDLAELATTARKSSDRGYRGEVQAERLRQASEFVTSTGPNPGTSLGGFASAKRQSGGIGRAENVFEAFEDRAWRKSQAELDSEHRRADDPGLNPFDIYVTFGDFAGDNSANHTVQKLSDVHILGTAKTVGVNGQPIQEVYNFIARNLV